MTLNNKHDLQMSQFEGWFRAVGSRQKTTAGAAAQLSELRAHTGVKRPENAAQFARSPHSYLAVKLGCIDNQERD
jgi:hypothetical protein